MDAMKRRVAALRAAEACSDDETHKGLKKMERELYYTSIYDEDSTIEFPAPVARTATVLCGLDHLQDGQLAPTERFAKVFDVFIWWSSDDVEAVPVQTWHHQDMRMDALLPVSKDPQDTQDFMSKFSELFWNNMVLAMVKQDSSSASLDPLLKFSEMFLKRYLDGKSSLEKKVAGLSSDVMPVFRELVMFARCIVALLNSRPMFLGASSDDVNWVFFNPLNRSEKRPADCPRNFKDLNAITKAIWHHMAGAAKNDQMQSKPNSPQLWQRLKVTYFQHSALDFQYAEPLQVLGTYFDSMEYSTFFQQEEEFYIKYGELKNMAAQLRPKACENEFESVGAAVQHIHAEVINMAETDVEVTKLDDQEVLQQLKATERVCSLIGATEHLPELKELMGVFSDQNILDQLVACCTNPLEYLGEVQALCKALNSLDKSDRNAEHQKYFVSGRSNLCKSLAQKVVDIIPAEASDVAIESHLEAFDKLNDFMDIPGNAVEAVATKNIAKAVVNGKSSLHFMKQLEESHVPVKLKESGVEKAVENYRKLNKEITKSEKVKLGKQGQQDAREAVDLMLKSAEETDATLGTMIQNHGWNDLQSAGVQCAQAHNNVAEVAGAAVAGKIWHEIAEPVSVTDEKDWKKVVQQMENTILKFNGDEMDEQSTVLQKAMVNFRERGTMYGDIIGWDTNVDPTPWQVGEPGAASVDTQLLSKAYEALLKSCEQVSNRSKVSKLEVRIAFMLKKDYPANEVQAKQKKQAEAERIQNWMMKKELKPGGVVHDALYKAYQSALTGEGFG